MLRKAFTLGMAIILALSLLTASMITCFTYDAEANVGNDGHGHWACWHDAEYNFYVGNGFHVDIFNLYCISY